MKYQDIIKMQFILSFSLRIFIVIIFSLFNTIVGIAQETIQSSPRNSKVWFVSTSLGVQMSGIKDEDFISKNIAPAITIGGGLWFTPEIALYVGYKGPYFNTIADNDKHYYNFTYGEVMLNITEIINMNNDKGKWNLIIHPGAGIFNNMYYGRPNVCFNLGILNSIDITKRIIIFVDISTIAGWDIYQGNDDILPSFNIGVKYNFLKR